MGIDRRNGHIEGNTKRFLMNNYYGHSINIVFITWTQHYTGGGFKQKNPSRLEICVSVLCGGTKKIKIA